MKTLTLLAWIEISSMMSRYHGSKSFGSQESFLTETAIYTVKRWKKSMGYHFVPESSQAQESHTCQFFRFFFCHIFRTTVCWDPDILLSSWTRDVTTCPLYKGLCQLKQIFFTFEFFRAMLSKVHLFACGMHLSISLIYIRWPCLHTPSPWPRIPLPPVYSRRFKAKPSLKVSVVHLLKVTFFDVLHTKSSKLNGILTFG